MSVVFSSKKLQSPLDALNAFISMLVNGIASVPHVGAGDGAATLSIMTVSITTLSITTLTI
jgi:hypothetical protein